MTYSVSSYGSMTVDRVRMGAYEKALRQAIKPGALVLEIGTGTGIFALLACKLGARQVIAVEPDDAVQVARQAAAANGLADRICFLQDVSTHIHLPERADVMLSDLRGVLPLFQQHIPSIVDARARLLAPGGVQIPQRDTLWAAVVAAPELYQHFAAPWATQQHGFDLQAGHAIVTNTWIKARLKPEQLVTAPQAWGTLDYTTIESPNVQATLTWEVAHGTIAHGLALWFDAELMDGIGFSNAPSEPEAIYGNAFLPWSQPVALATGDIITTHLAADLVGDDYIWRWETRILAQGDPTQVKADFKQSTFYGTPLSPQRLRKQAASYIPCLSEEGQINQLILSMMDGQTALAQIAEALTNRFPTRFANRNSALSKVGELSQKYSG